MSARRILRIMAAAALAIFGLVVASAKPAMASAMITSSGPLSSIMITDDLNCDVRHVDDTMPEWFGGTGCGTLAALNGTLYGPAYIPAGGAAQTTYTPVSQTPVTGDGTAANPYAVVTVVRAGNLAELTQTDRYVVGHEYYDTDVQVTNISGGPLTGNIYTAGDCYLQNDDYGYGRILGTTPGCTRSVEPGSRLMALVPRTGGNNFYEASYYEVWSAVGTKLPLPDTCRCQTRIDNGIAISWPLRIPAGESRTWSWTTTFSPEGHIPLVVSATAHEAASPARGFDGYRITISNGNPEQAIVHTITVTLPPDFSYIRGTTRGVTTADPEISGQAFTWTGPFTIPGAGEIELDFEVRVAAEPGRYTIDVNATADHDVTPEFNAAPITVGAVADLSLTKVASRDDITPGEPLTYALTAHNAGPSTAPDAVITDTLPYGFTFNRATSSSACFAVGQLVHCDVGALAAGDGATVTVGVNTSTTTYGFKYNDAVVSEAGIHDPDPLNNYAVSPVLEREARLLIGKTASPAFAGDEITWNMTVVNAGMTPASGATVTDTLPAGLTFVSAHTDSGSCSFNSVSHTLTCPLEPLASGQTAGITLVTGTPPDPVPPGSASVTVTNPATVSYGVETDTTSAQTRVFAAAHMVPAKTASPTPLVAGGRVTYEASATNEGPSVATSVNVADSLPEGFTYDAEASDPRCTLIDEATRTIRCVDSGPLTHGESVTFKIVAGVRETMGDGSVVVNDASVTASQLDPAPAESARVTSVVVRHVSLDITKVPSRTVVRAGRGYSYRITVSNHGPSAASDIVISDSISGLHFLSGGLNGGAKGGPDCPVTGLQFRCLIPELLPGDTETFYVPVTTSRRTPHHTVILNTVTAASADRGLARASASVLVVGGPRQHVKPPRPSRPPRLVRPVLVTG